MSLVYALLGTIIGSFLNVCIDRLPEGGSLISPPSHCSHCGRRLPPRDLIPVVSYLMLRGRCRTCGARIPRRVLLVELGTGLLFALIWIRYGASIETALVSIYTSILIVILVVDLEHHRILNRLTFPAILLALLASPFAPRRTILEVLGGGAFGFGLLLLIAFVLPGGTGMGDVKLAAFVGLAVGFPEVLLAMFLAFVLGGLVAGALLAAGVVKRRDPIPFGPFLAAGAVTTLLYGERILQWWAARS